MSKDGRKKRIPKHIGGVKIPKELRRTGEALIDGVIEKAQSQQGRESIARALTMAASVATAAVAKGRGVKAEAEPAPAPPTPPAPPAAPTFAISSSAAAPPVAAPIADPVPPHASPPPSPPHGTSQEPDFAAIAETIGATAEMMLGRLFGKKA